MSKLFGATILAILIFGMICNNDQNNMFKKVGRGMGTFLRMFWLSSQNYTNVVLTIFCNHIQSQKNTNKKALCI